MNIIEKIKSRGYWLVRVYPADFIERRISSISETKEIVESNAVKFRGWEFPICHTISTMADHVVCEVSWNGVHEHWRFYQSGQLVHLASQFFEWPDERELSIPNTKPGIHLGVGDTIAHFLEMFEFCARISRTKAGGDIMKVAVELHGLEGRHLYVDDADRIGFIQPRVAKIEKYDRLYEVTQAELLSRVSTLAAEAAIDVFERFEWKPTVETVMQWQEKLKKF